MDDEVIDFSKPLICVGPYGKKGTITLTIEFENEPSDEAIQSYLQSIYPEVLKRAMDKAG